jgi:predicted phosphodiesterase
LRYAVISDLHANLESLSEFICLIPKLSIEKVLCLGDLVGYNANPGECIDLLRGVPGLVCIRGNHDRAAITGKYRHFSPNAAAAIDWTIRTCTSEQLQYLKNLDSGPKTVDDQIVISHGSATDEDQYILSRGQASSEFEWLTRTTGRILFFGHTHIPRVYCSDRNALTGIKMEKTILLDPRFQYMINPGSLGQPRDGDPRASFGLLDSDSREYTLVRFEYDYKKTGDTIVKKGLPDFLARRLQAGR